MIPMLPLWLETSLETSFEPDSRSSVRPPAIPDDLTVAEARALGRADRVVCPAETPPAILARARADAHRLIHHANLTLPDAPGLTVVIEIAVI